MNYKMSFLASLAFSLLATSHLTWAGGAISQECEDARAFYKSEKPLINQLCKETGERDGLKEA